MAARQAVSLAVGLGGTLALTALLGPAGYGRFAAALALYLYALSVAPLGINAWLVRRVVTEGSDDVRTEPAVAQTARSVLLLSALAVGGVAALLVPVVERWMHAPAIAGLAFAMLAALPLQLITLVPLAALERALNYRVVAAAELQGLVLYYAVAVGLALRGWGPEAIVLGWWLQTLWIAVRVHRAAGMTLRLGWTATLVREALGYGLAYASSLWTYQLRDLVNPLIVGRWLGVEAVAVVALGVRLVDAASFVKAAVWRISLPALSRLQQDRHRLAIAVRDGMRLQLALVGPALLALATIGVPIALRLFGPEWIRLRDVMALIAAGTLCNAMFNLHSSALYALGRIAAVWRFHLLHVALFAGMAWTLVPLIGVAGYALSELCAMPAYVVLYAAFRRAVRTPDAPSVPQRTELLLGICLVVAVAGSAWTPWFAALALLPLLSGRVRSALRLSAEQARQAFTSRSPA